MDTTSGNLTDIRTRADIEKLIISFYEKVKTDPTIGFIFTDVVKIDWVTHVPVIVDFWETILLDNLVYHRNAMDAHFKVNKLHPLKPEHFSAWLSLFSATVDQLFEGPVAGLAKKRAQAIGSLLEFKMNRPVQ